jgi:CHAD domain-containing protein
MKAATIQSIIHKRCDKMGRHLSAVPIDFRPEDIHDFRVEYKKLRAFIHLLQEEGDAAFHPNLTA